jgi:hypothetical protein
MPELKLVVQLDPLANIEACIRIKQETDLNKEFAKKVAYNLFNFLQSFNKVIIIEKLYNRMRMRRQMESSWSP